MCAAYICLFLTLNTGVVVYLIILIHFKKVNDALCIFN